MGRTLLDRFGVSRRLVLISVAFTLPLFVTVSLVVTTISADIHTTRLELDGNGLLRPLEDLFDALTAHRQATLTSASDARRTLSSNATRHVDEAFERLGMSTTVSVRRCRFTADGLAQRKREHVRVATVKKEWADLKASLGGRRTSRVANGTRTSSATCGR